MNNSFKYIHCILFLIFSTLCCFANAKSDTTKHLGDYFQLRGYVKDMQTYSFTNGLKNSATDNLIHNRINVRIYPIQKLTIGIEFRNRLFWGETVKMTPNYGEYFNNDPGLIDMNWLLIDEHALSLVTQVDRAWVNWSNNDWNLSLGRQRINWGITSFWNSNDLFNAFSFTDFDYEERPGVDALKVQRYFNGLSNIEVAIKPSDTDTNWVAAGIYRFYKWQYDFQLLGGIYHSDIALGTGWAGNLKDASFKGEITYFHPRKEPFDTSGTVSLSSSLDYMFPKNIFASIGYLYNSSGIKDKITLNNAYLLQNNVSAKNLMPAMHSMLANITTPVTPLFSASIIGVYSPMVHSLLAMPTFGYSIANNWDLAVVIQSYWLGKELDNVGNAFYIRFKCSF